MTDRSPRSLAVQTVLFGHSVVEVRRFVTGVDEAAARAMRDRPDLRVTLLVGDCSPSPVLDDDAVAALRAGATRLAAIDSTFFDANLGHGGGHARLRDRQGDDRADAILVLNPDVLLAPTALGSLVDALVDGVGAVELRQLPLEHAKAYDPDTGATEWTAGAGILVDGDAWDAVGGFDHDVFPMYADDVDLSWRLRAAGYALRFEPRAVGFHAKRLNEHGGWDASELEWVSGYEADVALRARWGAPGDAAARLAELEASEDGNAVTAAANVRARGTDRLPEPRTDGDGIARPSTPGYTEMRFAL